MNVFIDTSAFLALLAGNDPNHAQAERIFEQLLAQPELMVTSNYVVAETVALSQNRMGIPAVRMLVGNILPVVRIEWVARELHGSAMTLLLTTNRRALSFVDCTSFMMIGMMQIKQAFAFDRHFEEQGFQCLR